MGKYKNCPYLYKNKLGIYRAKLWIEGVQRTIDLKTLDAKEAALKACQERDNIKMDKLYGYRLNNQYLPIKEGLCLALEVFKKELTKATYNNNNLCPLRVDLRPYIDKSINIYKYFKDINTHSFWEGFKTHFEASFLERNGCNISSRSFNDRVKFIRRLLKFAQKQGVIREPIKIEQQQSRPVREIGVVTNSIFEKIIENCDNDYELGIFDLLYSTGFRKQELFNLKKDDIDWDQKTIKINWYVSKNGCSRVANIHPSVELFIEKCMKSKFGRKKWYPRSDDELDRDYLFVDINGKRRKSCCKRLKKLLKKAGISKLITTHSFRHGFCRNLTNQGLSDTQTAKLMGHKTPRMSYHYSSLSVNEYKKIIQNITLSDALKKGLEK